MARIESQAVAGYYPTTPDQIPLIAAALTIREDFGKNKYSARCSTITVVDPCAGGYVVLDACRASGREFVGCDVAGEEDV